jgi:four helix bundle protein
MHNYKQLKIWQKAMDIVCEIYKTTAAFPSEEKFGLTAQMRRCAVSLSSNIAEGAGRNSDKEFCHFLAISHASSFELETQILVSYRLGFMNQEVTDSYSLCEQIHEMQKMNYTLQQKMNPELNHFGKKSNYKLLFTKY